MDRRTFATVLGSSLLYLSFKPTTLVQNDVSDFARHLKPMDRRLETPGYYVWGASPIIGPDGKTHLFYSRWPEQYGMGGWIHKSEIAHAVAESPEGPFQYISTIFTPKGGDNWDATTCHNPHIKQIDDRYYLFYMGNSNRKTDTKRIGLATSDSLYGPWKRPDEPLLNAGLTGAWDDHCTTNPSFVEHPNGQYWLYYKSWNTYEYEHYTDPKMRGNRKYGLAIAEKPEGPYIKYEGNPVLDYSDRGNNIQVEDGFVWFENKRFKMLLRDMGIFNHQYGLYIESADGIHWSEPKIAYYNTDHYFSQPPKPKHLFKYGRFERPQILFQQEKPTHLFLASQGGQYMTSSTFIFQIV